MNMLQALYIKPVNKTEYQILKDIVLCIFLAYAYIGNARKTMLYTRIKYLVKYCCMRTQVL